MSDTAPQNTLGPGSVDWRDLYKDPYLITAVVLALLVSVPLASPADTEFWLNEYSYYFDAPLLALTALALWKAASMAPSPRAQRFWKYLTVGFGFWLAIRLGGPFLTGTSPAAMLVTDLLYLAFYLFLILGFQVRPHQQVYDAGGELIQRLESTGATLFSFGMLVYFVLIPAAFSPDSLITSVPSAMLYAVLNVYLFARALSLMRSWHSDPWRGCYGWLVVATAGFILLDGLDLASRLDQQLDSNFRGTIFEAFWLLPMLGFIAAARLYARSSSGSDDLPAPAEFEELLWKWRGKLAYLALIPPMLHIALQITGWADDSTGTARDVFIVLWVFAAFGLSILYDRSLLSQQHRFAQRHSQTNQQLEVVRRMDAMHGGWHSSRFQ
jgi:hypothetical protein